MNKQKEKHGKGRLMLKEGGLYEGFFKNNKAYGYCRLVKENGDIYEGMNLHFKAHGRGTYKQLIKNQYLNLFQGTWNNDRLHGKAIQTITIIQQNQQKVVTNIQGNYEHGLLNGQGIIISNSQYQYIGDILNGKQTGNCVILYFQDKQGEKYVGEIQEGKKKGMGKYLWKDGSKYEGEFDNDLINGQGTFWFSDGTLYKGEFKDGYQHGLGYQLSDDGVQQIYARWNQGQVVEILDNLSENIDDD